MGNQITYPVFAGVETQGLQVILKWEHGAQYGEEYKAENI